MITPPGYQPQPRRKLYGLPLIITGGVVAVLAFILVEAGSRSYNLCNSGAGAFAQAVSTQAATNCQQTDTGHAVCMVAIAVGVVLAVAGVIRLFWMRQQPPAAPVPPVMPPPQSAAPPRPPAGWR
jgi:hypothetical protein